MISENALSSIRHIVCHDSCADGTASAMLLHDALPDVPVEFVQYDTDRHKTMEAIPGVLFCDFSPHPTRMQEFLGAGAIVLDHHRTAKAVVQPFVEAGRGVWGDEATQPGVCGTWMAYEHVWYPLRGKAVGEFYPLTEFARRFARLAGVRDTWMTYDPSWTEACVQSNALHFMPQSTWLTIPFPVVHERWPHYMDVGEVIWARQRKDVQKALDRAYRFETPGGLRVLVIPSTSLISDVSEAAGGTVDLAVGMAHAYEPGTDAYPKLIVSTRSKTTFDCAAFCKSLGGGGHTKAAGAALQLDTTSTNAYALVRGVVEAYEKSLMG